MKGMGCAISCILNTKVIFYEDEYGGGGGGTWVVNGPYLTHFMDAPAMLLTPLTLPNPLYLI